MTAADLAGEAGVAYACTRPPGHHVTRSAFGGSCYLNNAAIAAQRLRDNGAARVAIVDVDAHHGNGAQAIFWERDDVLTGSVHVDPRAGWFPHFLGTDAERGAGAGAGANLNLPLAPGTADEGWLAAVADLAGWVEGVDALVVALGVDAAAGDPESPLLVTAEGYREAGRRLGALGLADSRGPGRWVRPRDDWRPRPRLPRGTGAAGLVDLRDRPRDNRPIRPGRESL